MSQQIENEIVKMQFDNTGFEKNVHQTMSTLDKFKRMLHFDKVNMTPLQQAFAETEATATKAGFHIRDVWLKVASTLEDQIANKIVDTGKKIFNALSMEGVTDGFNEYELKMGSIQTIMAGTGESLATVNKYLDELNTYSDKTIYSFADMTSNIGKFTNAGVNLKDAVAAIKGIANEAAVSGANANEASRAMYNFSQALSAGYVKLIDWKSIENANMATKEFKQTLIDVAQGIGTVVKVGDDWQTTTTNMQGKVSDLFNSTKNFNDSLNHQWMTTDVLNSALKIYATNINDLSDKERETYENELRALNMSDEQIKRYEELGIKAANAATEIKTFTMLIDTLKEAIGSGWAMTWQYMIGDFEQAKALWTDVGNTLGDVIGKVSDARNNFVREALRDGWEKTIAGGGLKDVIPDAEKFRGILIDLAHNQGILNKKQYDGIVDTNTLMESLHQYGWMTGDLLKEAVSDYTNILSSMSDVELSDAGFSKEDVANLSMFNMELALSKDKADELAESMNNLGGRENVIQGLFNLFGSFRDTLKPIGEAFNNVFGILDPAKLFNLTRRFREFTEQLKVSEDAAGTIRTAFTLMFTGIKTAIGAVATTINGVNKLILPVLNLFDAVFGLIGKIIAALTGSKGAVGAADKFAKAGDTIGKKYLAVMQKVADVINKVADAIRGIPESVVFEKIHDGAVKAVDAMKEFWNAFEQMPIIQEMVEDFNKSVENIERKMTPVINKVKKSLDEFKAKVKTTFTLESLNKGLTVIYENIKKFINLIKSFADRIKTFFSGLKEGKSIIESFQDSFGDIIEKVKELRDNIMIFFDDLFSKSSEMEGKFNLEEIQQAIHNFVANITPDQVTMIAVAGTFMLIALNLLRLSTALRDAVDAFTGIGLALKNVINSYVKKQKSTILQIAESIVIVAAALWVLAQVPKEQLWEAVKAMTALTGCLAVMTGVLTLCGVIMHKYGGGQSMVKLASGLALLAGSFTIIALTLKLLEKINVAGVLPKIGAMALVMAGLAGLSLLMSKLDKFGKSSLTMLAVTSSLLIAAEAMLKVAQIPEEQLVRSMSIMYKLMIGLAALTFASSKIGVFSAVGLIAMVLTLDKLLPSIEKIVNYDYSKINAGLDRNAEMMKKMVGVMIIMTGIGMLAGNRIKGAAIAMLAVSGTFAIMIGIAKLAGMMKPTELRQGEKFLMHMAGLIALIELCSTKAKIGLYGGKESEGSKSFIRIAVAMGLMLGIAKLASKMKAAELAKGGIALLGLVGIIGAMEIVAAKAKNSEGTFKAVNVMLFAVAAVLGMVALLSIIPMGNMLPTLGAVLAIITALGFLASSVSKNIKAMDRATQFKASSVAGLIAACITLGFLSSVLVALSKESPDNVSQAAGAMVAVVASVALLTRALGKVNGDAFDHSQFQAFVGAIMMIIGAAAVVYCLSLALKKFDIDKETVITAAESLAIVLVGITPALAVINHFGSEDVKWDSVKNAVIGAVGVLLSVGATVGLLSKFGGDNSKMIAASQAISIALCAISVPIAVLGAVGKFVDNVDYKAMMLVVSQAGLALLGVTASILVLSNFGGDGDKMIAAAQAISTTLLAICFPIGVLGAVGKFCKTANPAVMIASVAGAVGALLGITYILANFAGMIDVEAIERLNSVIPSLVTAVAAVGVLAIAISAAGLLAGGDVWAVVAGGAAVLEAIAMLGLIITAIAVLGRVCADNQLFSSGLEKGLDVLVLIFNKLGEAVGALISGFGLGLTSNLSKIADRLNEFSEKLVPFTENMSKINKNAVNGCKNLAAAMLYITAAEFLDGLSRWTSLFGFGKKSWDFKELGTAVADFADSIKDVTKAALVKADLASNIVKKLASITDSLDATGGVASWLFGEKDLSKFADGMKKFGEALASFCESIEGKLPEDAKDLVQRACDATTPLIDLTGSLVASDGVLQMLMGEQDISDFGAKIETFALKLQMFMDSLSAIDTKYPTYPDMIQKCADATQPLVDLADGIQNSGGKLAEWVGDNTLDVFGATLIPFADSLKGFIAKISYIASHEPNYVQLITDVTEATKKLVELANSLDEIGGIKTIFSGDNTLDRFGGTLEGYGVSLSAFIDRIADINFSKIDTVYAKTNKLLDLAKDAKNTPIEAFETLEANITSLANMPVSTLETSWSEESPDLLETIKETFDAIIKLVAEREKNDAPTYTSYGYSAVKGVADAIVNNTYLVIGSLTSMVTAITTYLGSAMSKENFEGYGANVSAGLAEGISNNADSAISAAEALAEKVSDTIKSALKEHSPSRLTREDGKNLDLGLALGIRDHVAEPVKAAEAMSEEVVKSASTIISKLAQAINEDVDAQPVIRPVLDTTDLERGARRVGSLFSSSDLQMAYSISGAVKGMAVAKNGYISEPENTTTPAAGTQINYTQNNYSPKPLSRVEIYRDTKNMLSAMKGVVRANA